MKRKTLIFFVIGAIFLSGCNSDQDIVASEDNATQEPSSVTFSSDVDSDHFSAADEDNESSKDTSESAAEEVTPIYEGTFRNTSWGMSMNQVRTAESTELIGEVENHLVYYDTVLGKSAIIFYEFEDDELVTASYMFDLEHTSDNLYYEDYLTVVKSYTEKYGEPAGDTPTWRSFLYQDRPEKWGFAVSKGDVVFITRWELEDTLIRVTLAGDNYDITLMAVYNPIDYQKSEDLNGI